MLTLRGPFLQVCEEEYCELESWVTINTSGMHRGLFHSLFIAAVLRGGWEVARFPWQNDPFHAQLPVTCHLPTSCTLGAFCVEIMAGERERRKPGWVVLQQLLTDIRLW